MKHKEIKGGGMEINKCLDLVSAGIPSSVPRFDWNGK